MTYFDLNNAWSQPKGVRKLSSRKWTRHLEPAAAEQLLWKALTIILRQTPAHTCTIYQTWSDSNVTVGNTHTVAW